MSFKLTALSLVVLVCAFWSGCIPPASVGTAVIAARADAVATSQEVAAMAATQPSAAADRAVHHLATIAELLRGPVAFFRHVDPAEVK